MPTVINTNLASLFAQNSLSNAQNNLAQSVQRLSSGLRINSAKDDAAGLTIAQNMQSQINGVNQSIRNLSDATNYRHRVTTAPCQQYKKMPYVMKLLI
jgi:flagellin